jgi:hypothetical protein
MWFRLTASIVGAGLVVVGIFMPFLGMPIFRDENYFEISAAGAIILLALAGLSLLAAAFRKFGWLYLTGAGSLGLLLYSIQKVSERKATVLSDLSQSLKGSPLHGLGVGFVKAVDYRYGWAVMLLGAIILIAVPLIGNRIGLRSSKPSNDGDD